MWQVHVGIFSIRETYVSVLWDSEVGAAQPGHRDGVSFGLKQTEGRREGGSIPVTR
jgi:hypothetical protein